MMAASSGERTKQEEKKVGLKTSLQGILAASALLGEWTEDAMGLGGCFRDCCAGCTCTVPPQGCSRLILASDPHHLVTRSAP